MYKIINNCYQKKKKKIINNNNTTVQKYNIRNRPKNRHRLDIPTEKYLERKYINIK